MKRIFLISLLIVILAFVALLIIQLIPVSRVQAQETPYPSYETEQLENGCLIITTTGYSKEVCPSTSEYDLLVRYVDAINQQDYHRAYMYWGVRPMFISSSTLVKPIQRHYLSKNKTLSINL